MSQVEVERFLGRVITDDDFRQRAATNLVTACYDEGMVLSAQEMSLLDRLDLSWFDPLAGILDGSLRR